MTNRAAEMTEEEKRKGYRFSGEPNVKFDPTSLSGREEMTDTNNGWPSKPGAPLNPEQEGPHWLREDYPQSEAADALEAQAAEITRLRAAINDALTAPFPDPELNSTWHQEPIGPNETPEEAIKRLVSVRAEWEVYKNNCENPVIAELRAELATARREGMEQAADLCGELTWEESKP